MSCGIFRFAKQKSFPTYDEGTCTHVLVCTCTCVWEGGRREGALRGEEEEELEGEQEGEKECG